MIRFEDVTITYEQGGRPVVQHLDLQIPEGEMCVVVGRTGSGKTTILRAVNGLVPHFSGGELSGRVLVEGRSTADHPPRELADLVGFVGQDPLAGFITDSVEEELAYAMESLAVPPDVMRRRVEETLDLLGLVELRGRALRTLSGGEQQRVAIGAALTAHQRILVLDEPTSALDPAAGEEVLAALHRLVHDVGITVLMAEHRLERVAQHADRMVLLGDPGTAPLVGLPGEVLANSSLAPPVVRLGRVAGWSPPPVSVRDARRLAATLRDRLEGSAPPPTPGATGAPLLEARGVQVRYAGCLAVRDVDLELRAGEVVALLGRNGSGKSSLLWALQGTGARQGGTVAVAGDDPAELPIAERARRVGLVPQEASDLLGAATVRAEVADADQLAGAGVGTTRALLERIVPGIDDEAHPRDLSDGQRLALALAVVLVGSPPVLLLDEPTRGLDVPAKAALARVLRELAADGRAVVLSTHDVEFVAEVASRVVLLADGERIADGEVQSVLAGSPAFAPQVSKVLAPLPWRTVEQVRHALERAGTPA